MMKKESRTSMQIISGEIIVWSVKSLLSIQHYWKEEE